MNISHELHYFKAYSTNNMMEWDIVLQSINRWKFCKAREYCCYSNSEQKLESTGKDCTHEFLVAQLNRSTHLRVLLAEDVGQTLEQNARLDESVKRQVLFSHWIVAVHQALYEVRRQTVTHLCQHYNIQHQRQLQYDIFDTCQSLEGFQQHLTVNTFLPCTNSQWYCKKIAKL